MADTNDPLSSRIRARIGQTLDKIDDGEGMDPRDYQQLCASVRHLCYAYDHLRGQMESDTADLLSQFQEAAQRLNHKDEASDFLKASNK